MRRAAVMLLCAASWLAGQSYQGGLRGRVTDGQSAAVGVAKVTLLDEEKNTTRSTLTNPEGEFVFSAVDPARYSVIVESPGFKRFEKKAVELAAQAFLTVDIKLELGQVNETVQVTEEVPLIETSNASTGQNIDRQKLEELPNLGRNPFMMVKLATNVQQVGDPRFNRMQDQTGSSAISIAGGPVRGNNYLLDGVPITDSTNRAVIIPTIESVDQVKIQANTYDAEMGRTGGGVFNTFLKSGTNQVHGSALGYMRESWLLANSFFNNRAGIARPDQPFRNYGGSFGGPVWIPKLYDGRNRTFFWLGAEAYRQRSALTQDYAVPTALERGGDFSQSRMRNGAPLEIFDPLTTRSVGSGFVRDLFPGGVIPASRINPIGRAMAGFFPNPQRAVAFHGAPNFTGAGVLVDRADQVTAKVDHEVTKWWRANASYLHYGSTEPSGNLFGSVSAPGITLLGRKVDSTQVNNILTPNATTVVSVRYGFNRFPNEVATEADGFSPARLGFTGPWLNDIQYVKFPVVGMQNMTNMGAGGTSWTVFHSKNLLASVSKFLGRHSIKTGFDYRVFNIDFISYGSSSGSFSFNDAFTRRDPTRANDGSGSDVASLLLGYPSGASAQVATKFFQFFRYYAGYVHDDFRVNSKLTLNLGLRYEYETGLAERSNQLIVGFDREARNPIGAPGGLMYAGQNGYGTACCTPPRAKLGPRAGAAYALNGKTTIRGGYGLFWAPMSYGGFSSQGYTQITEYIGSFDGNATPAGSLSNPFPTGLLKPVGNSLGYLAGVGQSISFIDQNAGATRVHQFSFDVQRQLPGGVALAVGYVGSRTRNLILGTGAYNLNQLRPESLALGAALNQQVDNPFFGRPGAIGVIAPARITRSQALRPFPQYGAVTLSFDDFNSARYDSIAVKAQKRFATGLMFLGAWTWSRNYDASFGAGNFFSGSTASPQDIYNLGSEYGLSLTDSPHRFSGTFSYELPFGKGKRWLGGNKVLDYAVGGWQVNGVTVIQTGFPLALTQNNNLNSVIGAGLQRPNATGVSAATSGSLMDRLDNYLNPAAFTATPQFTFGNVTRTIPNRGPGQVNWDISILKTFVVWENFKAQFRAEAMNAFNTPYFNGPNTAVGNASFGRITRQANFPRYVQLGVRFFF